MENFRDFEIGPDPFGRTWRAQFKYLQTGISIRHSDSVDVCFILTSGEEQMIRTVVMQHADLREYTKRTGREFSDTWCSRLAVCRLRSAVETAEDLEKDFLQVTPAEIAEYDAAVKNWEQNWVRGHAA